MAHRLFCPKCGEETAILRKQAYLDVVDEMATLDNFLGEPVIKECISCYEVT